MKERLEGCEQNGVERRVARLAEGLERGGQLRVELERLGRAAEGLHRRAQSVGRQIEHRQLARELLAPEGHEALAIRPGQQTLLPLHVVCVLQRERWERGRFAAPLRLVEHTQFMHEHGQRPEVRRDVMHHDEQNVFGLPRARVEAHAHQRPSFKIEGAVRLCDEACAQILFAPVRGVLLLEADFGVRRDALHGHAAVRDVGRAQRRVAVNQSLEGAPERACVQLGADAHRAHDVVGGTLRRDAVHESQGLLPAREQMLMRRRLFGDDAPRLRRGSAGRMQRVSLCRLQVTGTRRDARCDVVDARALQQVGG